MRPVDDKIRSVSEKELRTIKAATDAGIDLGGGVGVVLRRCRASGSQLSKYANRCHPAPDGSSDQRELYVPVDVAMEIDRCAKSPVILAAYAEMLGYRLEPVTDPTHEARKLTDCDVMDFMREASDVFNALIDARADGHLCCGDKQSVETELRELERKIAQLRINLMES